MLGEILNKVKAIRDDWTAAKAAFLDVAVSSRAPANTALSTATWNATKAGYLDAPISGITAGGTRRVVALSTTGSNTWTHPSDLNPDKFVIASWWGGGGAGGRGLNPQGGGGGQVLFRIPMVLGGSSTAYTIGVGGTGRATNGAGEDGSDTTFNSVVAVGGGGGVGDDTSPPQNGGGFVDELWLSRGPNICGGTGGRPNGGGGYDARPGIGVGGADNAGGGGGGGSWFTGGAGATTSINNGSDGQAFGGGGGGGSEGGTSGDGAQGYIIIEYEAV